jgi:hypothetical protein
MMMNKFVLPVLGLLFLFSSVSAYQITIDAPETVSIGKPLVVNGTTTLGIGTPIDVVLYHQVTTSTEVKRTIAYVQNDNTFRTVFDTTNLKKGTYKVEVPVNGLGDSVTMRLVRIVDRSDEIDLISSFVQQYTGTLKISGTMKGNLNSGIQIEISRGEGERVLGPQYISTNSLGYFSVDVPITKAGTYDVSFTDSKGFIGTESVSVIGSEPTPTVIVPTTVTTAGEVLSAHAKSTRDTPAYFEVITGSYTINVYTSSSIDWMIEYVDDRGVLHTLLNRNQFNPEAISVQGRGKTIYFKIYPFKYSDSGTVFLYAENAQSVKVSPSVPSVFLTVPPTTAETQKSPLVPVLGVVAVGLALVLTGAYRKK